MCIAVRVPSSLLLVLIAHTVISLPDNDSPSQEYGPPKSFAAANSIPDTMYGSPKAYTGNNVVPDTKTGSPKAPSAPKPVYGPPKAPSAPKPAYGPPKSPSAPKPVYGPPKAPSAPKPVYGPPKAPSAPKPVYGPPKAPSVPKPVYGPPKSPSAPKPVYGPPKVVPQNRKTSNPPKASGPTNAPNTPNTSYGPPKAPSATKVATPNTEYGPPKAPSATKVASPNTEYGPPKVSAATKPDTKYGPPSAPSLTVDVMYGPPDFTPGEPLDHYATSASDNTYFQVALCNNTDLIANKQLVKDFYQNVFGDKRQDLIERYVAGDVINHSPTTADGRQSIVDVLNGPLGEGPRAKVDFKHVSAEGDLVWLHTRLPVPALNATFAVVDIFRINCAGVIQEHWDVMQDTNVNATNLHPFFYRKNK